MNWFAKRKVLAPVDFSDESFAAVDTALELVEDAADVTVVYVLQDLSPMEPGELWNTVDKESRIQHAMKALRERLADDKYKGLHFDVVIGDPGHEIAELAEREGSNLIVLPSHGRTGLKRMLIGSVAERVVRLAHCPVLVLRS
ncbi:MAG: universal stress protein [Planctomycetaceae bacterium]|nr:universal stress protein [Planctomycetales bacterium]MCB9873875.1 universal stress protein [Planctomycetaceae bacterium]MCB9936612.1 universal stress protein [Planctomycetaceae bacterium]